MKYSKEELISHIQNAFEKSDINESKLPKEILEMEGMSGLKTRHLYNNICNLENANYLEVGTWKGSSFVSAIFQNNINSLAIDNWSEFYNYDLDGGTNNIGSKYIFESNVNKFCPKSNFNFLEKDSFSITKEDLTFDSIDIYLYDGAHDYDSHKRAITHYSKFLSKLSIVIIDDWRSDNDWMKVQRGTFDGFSESDIIVHHKIERISQQENNGKNEYWNGVGVFICEKNK